MLEARVRTGATDPIHACPGSLSAVAVEGEAELLFRQELRRKRYGSKNNVLVEAVGLVKDEAGEARGLAGEAEDVVQPVGGGEAEYQGEDAKEGDGAGHDGRGLVGGLVLGFELAEEHEPDESGHV